MKKKAVRHIPSMDATIVKTIEELRAYAKTHPEAEAVTSVLEAILERLIQEFLGSDPNEGEDKLPILPLEELASLFPDSPIPLLYLSKVCLYKGDHEAALRYAEAGLPLRIFMRR